MGSIFHASTSRLRSRSQFIHLVDKFRELCKDRTRVLLFSLSHDAPDLEQSIKQLSSCAPETIGCISGPLPAEGERSFSCSVAVLEKDACVPFSSLETGEGPVQVGRWHSYINKPSGTKFDGFGGQGLDGEVNWDEIWNTTNSSRFLPRELKNVRDARSLIYFSDSSSWELATALHEHLPQAQQLGVMASPTPFITGHPFTLFRNGKLQASGAVGLALQDAPVKRELHFEGLVRLTEPLIIRKAEGNLIHELGDSLPARILLKSIQDHGLPDELAKDVDYYIGIRDSNERDGEPSRLLRIVAGSPSRGSIAVEEVPAPPDGTSIEFYYRPKSSPVCLPAVIRRNVKESNTLIGTVVDTIESNQANNLDLKEFESLDVIQPQIFKSSFLISSEYGFVLSTGSLGKTLAPWKCTVPGTFGGLRLPL